MKLQAASKKELIRIAKGSSVCAAISLAGFVLLDQLNIIPFSYRIVIGLIGGTIVAIVNFALMCLMVQNAAGTEDKKQLRAKVQLSYNLRLFIQAGWVVLSFCVPAVSVIAAALPLLFPTAVIYYLRSKGKLISEEASPRSASMPPEEPEQEDIPGPFEA